MNDKKFMRYRMRNINIRVPEHLYLAAWRQAGVKGQNLTEWVREQLKIAISTADESAATEREP